MIRVQSLDTGRVSERGKEGWKKRGREREKGRKREREREKERARYKHLCQIHVYKHIQNTKRHTFTDRHVCLHRRSQRSGLRVRCRRHVPHSAAHKPLWHVGSPGSLAADGTEQWKPASYQPLCISTGKTTNNKQKKQVHQITSEASLWTAAEHESLPFTCCEVTSHSSIDAVCSL